MQAKTAAYPAGMEPLARLCRFFDDGTAFVKIPARKRAAWQEGIWHRLLRKRDDRAAAALALRAAFQARQDAFAEEQMADAAAEGVSSGNANISEKDAARVFDSYGSSILRLSYTYLRSMDDAEDILQETLIRYMLKAPAFESELHEKAWLLKVAANLSKNRLRSIAVRRTDELSDMLAAEEREDLSFVWEAVSALPERYREVIHLFYQEGFQTAEIAAILGMNESTVRSDLRRGRERLKKILKEVYDFE